MQLMAVGILVILVPVSSLFLEKMLSTTQCLILFSLVCFGFLALQ